MFYPSRVALLLSSILLSAIVPKVAAESAPGVTSTSIRIGSCSALTGPTSFLGIQTQLGASPISKWSTMLAEFTAVRSN